MAFEVLTIGSLTFDLFIRPKDVTVMRFSREAECPEEYMALPYGGKVAAREVHENFGGGGHNTAVGITRLGIKAMPIGAVSGDVYGARIRENLKNESISDDLVEEVKGGTGFSVIINSFEGERTVLHYPGANALFRDFDESILDEAQGFFFNHLSCDEEPSEKIFRKIEHHFTKYPEKFLAWNPGNEQLSKEVDAFQKFLPVVDILILNREEAELFTGLKARKSVHEQFEIQRGPHFIPGGEDPFPHYAADYAEIFRAFAKKGVRNIVITDSRRGAQLSDGKTQYFSGIHEDAPRVDTLGAGDAFGSALFSALYAKKDLPFALKCATINAASVISFIGAQTGLLSQSELLQKLESTSIVHAEKPLDF